MKIVKSGSGKNNRELKRQLQPKKHQAPFRFGTLTPLHLTGHDLSLSDYAAFRLHILNADELSSIKRNPYKGSWEETIIRACYMLFFIIDSGGLQSGSPDIEINKLLINIQDAKLGFLSPAQSSEPLRSQKSETESAEDVLPLENDLSLKSKLNSAVNIRIPLFAGGKLHYNSFVFYRRNKQKAGDGQRLLPPTSTLEPMDIEVLKRKFPWLRTLKNPADFQ